MKNAEVTIEITLSIALSIVVLFLTLGLFSDNLKSMASNSGIHNLFNRNNEIAKTKTDSWGIDPTKTQVNVQVVADQGLDWYISNAQATIDKYLKTPPTTSAQMGDLAKAETIAKIGGVLTASTENTLSKYPYGISIKSKNTNQNTGEIFATTTVNNKTISYSSINGDKTPLEIVQEVTRKF